MAEREKSYVPGIILIVMGVILLLHQLDFIFLRWRHIFPIILLALGVFFLISTVTRKDKGAAFPATVLLVLGLFFFFRNFAYFSVDYYFYDFEEYWPIFLIAFGLGFIVLYFFKPEDWGVLIPGGVLLFFGALFFLRSAGIFYWRDFADFWPLILIAIGISIVISSLKRKIEKPN
ncbi:MAG: LiaI-LiaF-like domain-containing protein [bacterium]